MNHEILLIIAKTKRHIYLAFQSFPVFVDQDIPSFSLRNSKIDLAA